MAVIYPAVVTIDSSLLVEAGSAWSAELTLMLKALRAPDKEEKLTNGQTRLIYQRSLGASFYPKIHPVIQSFGGESWSPVVAQKYLDAFAAAHVS